MRNSNSDKHIIAVIGDDDRSQRLAQWLACEYFSTQDSIPDQVRFTFNYESRGLVLADRQSPAFRPLWVDGNHITRITGKQPLLRAIGDKRQSVIDATAGLGKDAMFLAQNGFKVLAIERSPVIACLFADALFRRQSSLAGSLQLLCGESTDLLRCQQKIGDVIYLDPMYPARQKITAAKRKSMRMLQNLLGADDDSRLLFTTALEHTRAKVVVKRPPDIAPLVPNPAVSYATRLVRYDVYRVSRDPEMI